MAQWIHTKLCLDKWLIALTFPFLFLIFCLCWDDLTIGKQLTAHSFCPWNVIDIYWKHYVKSSSHVLHTLQGFSESLLILSVNLPDSSLGWVLGVCLTWHKQAQHGLVMWETPALCLLTQLLTQGHHACSHKVMTKSATLPLALRISLYFGSLANVSEYFG